MPAIAMEVIDLCRQDGINIKQIAKTISNDPALSTKILKTVNSSYYGLSQPVSTISHALVILGLNSVKTLALSFTLVSTVRNAGDEDYDPNVIFRRSLYAAVAARSIAQRVGIAECEEAFLAGLLQDLGVIAMVQTLKSEYVELLSEVGDDHEKLWRAERKQMKIDHAQVGEALAKKWRLPEVLVEPIRHHHQPQKAPPAMRQATQAVALGGLAADVFLRETSCTAMQDLISQLRSTFGIDASDATDLLETIGNGTQEIAKLFEIDTGKVRDVGEILCEANEVLQEVSLKSQQDLTERNRKLQEKATRDALTGAANRGHFNETLCRWFEQASRQSAPLSMILLDGDKFKSVNDTHGHLAGDRVLMTLAKTLMDNAPEEALVARYGGEEFTVLIPGLSRPEAAQVAEKLRLVIESTDIEADEDLVLRITASMGVATYDGVRFFKRPEQLIKAADQAVYAAKAAGRNCVRVFAPRVPAAV
ncbi:GGDEF domain-containing protein [Planctomycetales bacterium ZRK34]|nr:GGDEF domain-containing protein [Planctomycetales bacterium ZRK34]